MTFKVANIIARYNSKSGGPPRTVSEIAAAGAGHWVSDLFTTDYQESPSDILLTREFPGKVNILPAKSGGMIGGISMLAGIQQHHRLQLLKGVAPDVVHIHGVWSAYLAAFALTALKQRIPLIVTPHGMLEPWSLQVHSTRKSLAMLLFQRKILTRASAIHATSTTEADNIRRLGIGSAPVFVVPNSVAEPAARSSCEERALSTPEGGRLLFLSRLHEKKGLDILLQAWNQTRPRGWRLLIVGSGEPKYEARLKRFCQMHDVPDVEFKPHVEGAEREATFRDASVFILPTYSENFGNAVAEALIRGLPVITTTGTPWSDVVKERCGWYIEPTVSELKRVIAEATSTDGSMLAQMGARGRRYAMDHFTLPVVRNGLMNMYRAAIGRNGAP
jgi:glycosyltransferase involved in cell wall biosynthesis